MKAYGEVDVQIDAFLTSALAGRELSASRPGHFTPRERVPGIHGIRGWVGPRAGLDNMETRKYSICILIKTQTLDFLISLSYPFHSHTSNMYIEADEPAPVPENLIPKLANQV
jgi:hypothetical protein